MFGYIDSDFEEDKFFTLCKQLLDDPRYWVEEISDSYFMRAPESVDDLHSQHTKKSIYNIKRAERKLLESSSSREFKVLITRSEISLYLNDIRRLFAERWRGRYVSLGWKKDSIFNKYARAFLTLADQDRSRLFVLTDSSKVIAFHFCIIKGDILHVFQHASSQEKKYKKFSTGRIITYKMLKHIILNEPNIKIVDFMYGDNEYKRFWTDETTPVYCAFKKNYKGLRHLILHKTKKYIKILMVSKK